ncbi:hypothetical protein [Eisenibacter elegans]|jgi:hypothetical protein|uniref:hypothetical protein n=1 Tax=Eisenibacter elegans TaxID=997 RepID=UPI0003FC56E9|nr:hypothetical protein [Eisenibacter elegans]
MRIHLFEIEDWPYYPDRLRQGQTDYLRWLMETFDVFRAVIPRFAEALVHTQATHIQDLCSGGGGSVLPLRRHLSQHLPHGAPDFVLSDLYPNLPAYEALATQSGGHIRYVDTPLNALDAAAEPQSFRTIFNGFHHFRPPEAQQLLQQAVAQQMPIGIFEPLDKSVWQFVVNTLALTVLMWVATPFIRPFRWDKMLFTYLIPLIPLCTLWDGWVSILRLYSPQQLRQMTTQADPKGLYHWDIGKARHGFGVVIYAIGYPKSLKEAGEAPKHRH